METECFHEPHSPLTPLIFCVKSKEVAWTPPYLQVVYIFPIVNKHAPLWYIHSPLLTTMHLSRCGFHSHNNKTSAVTDILSLGYSPRNLYTFVMNRYTMLDREWRVVMSWLKVLTSRLTNHHKYICHTHTQCIGNYGLSLYFFSVVLDGYL